MIQFLFGGIGVIGILVWFFVISAHRNRANYSKNHQESSKEYVLTKKNDLSILEAKALLGIKPNDALDKHSLKKFYVRAMRQIHPDRHNDKNTAIRRMLSGKTESVIRAYRLLLQHYK